MAINLQDILVKARERDKVEPKAKLGIDVRAIADKVRERTSPLDHTPANIGSMLTRAENPDQMSREQLDAMAVNAATGIPIDVAKRNAPDIKLMGELNREMGARINAAGERIKSVSTIGPFVNESPRVNAQQAKSPAETLAIAKEMHDKKLITDEEFERFKKNPKTLPLWAEPNPTLFQSKAKVFGGLVVAVAEEVPRGAAAGVNGTLAGMAGAVEWLGGGTLVSKGARSIADFLEENVEFVTPEDPSIVFDVASGFGSMATFIVPGRIVTKGVNALHVLSRGAAAFLEASIFAVNESLVEAGSVYRERIAQTGSRKEAERAARFVFFWNLPANAISTKLGLFAGKNRIIRSIIAEGPQEGFQSVISQIPTREAIDFAQVRHEALIGAIVGGGTGALMQAASKSIEAIPELSTEAQQVYNEAEQAALVEGATPEAADIAGTQALGATEEGQAYIEATANAMDAVLQAEAAIGKLDEPGAILPTEKLTDEEFETLFTPEATEKDIVDKLIADVEQAPFIEAEQAELQEALTGLQISRQQETKTQLEQRAAKIETDAITALTTLTEGQDPLPHLEALGSQVFDEGITDIKSFSTRMQEKLGELWEQFKEFIQAIFDKLKSERGSIEFGRDVPLFPELQFDENLRPVFDSDNRLSSLKALVEEGGRVQQSIKELKDIRKQDIIKVIDKIQNNQALNNEAEKTTALAIAESLGNAFFAQVGQSKGDFLDATEVLVEGELEQITDKGIEDFIAGITFEKVKKPTKAQIQKAQIKAQSETIKNLEQDVSRLKGIAQRQSTQAFRQEERLEETTDILVAELKEQVRLVRVARREGRSEAVAKAREQIDAIRGRLGREKTKGRIERETRKTVTQFVKDTIPLSEQGKFLKAVVNAKTPKQFGEVIERAQRFAEEFTESDLKKRLRGKIKKELKTTKAKKTGGKPVGKFTPEVQNTLDLLRDAAKLKTEEAEAKVVANLAQYPDTIPPDDVALENRVLSMVHGFDNRTSAELETLLQEIKDLKDEGSMINELKKFNRQGKNEKAVIDAVDVVTGGKGLPASISAGEKAAKAEFDKVQGLTDRAKRWFASVDKSFVSWDDTLRNLSRLETKTERFESELNKLGDVLAAENAEKSGLLSNIEAIKKIYRTSYNIKTDRQVMKKINEDSKPVELGVFLDLNGNEINLVFTKAEARKRYAEFQNEALESTFTEGMGYTEDMRAAISEMLTPEDKAFVQAQFDYYNKYYDGINNVYRDIYGVDLIKNEFYSPIRREGVGKDEVTGFGEFLQSINFGASVAPKGLIARVKNIRAIKQQSDLAVLEQHVSEMEHFKAWAIRMRDLRALFGNSELRTAIKIFHGNDILGLLDNFMADFTRGGVDRAARLNWLDKLRANLSRSVLALKASIGVKQLTSFIAYADHMPAKDFVVGVAKFWKNPIENTRFLRKHSIALRTRGQYMERDIKTALKSDQYATWKDNPNFLNSLMLNIQLGDQGAIVMGGWPLFNYHIEQGKSVEESIRIFEKVMKQTQQSADLSDLSSFQRGGSFAKLFTMFLSAPNMFYRNEIAAIKDAVHGKGTKTQLAKTLLIYHILIPMLFQYVSDAFTWDEDEQLRAVILGPFNGLFIVGSLFDGMLRKALGLKRFDDEVPIMSIIDDAVRAMDLLDPNDLDAEETFRAIRALASGVGKVTGKPIKTAIDIGAGIEKVLTGDFEQGAAQALGWSPFVAEKRTKKNRSAF